ncbi:MAG TPA: hypothetical protein VGN93_08685 [Shinella sp.]|uniref:hypothetical protein n=1 Tax=Shinella sp. TaxID=1870904 RepID=UPI002E1288AC|nr:hypothetical protein [Shinella sp.]
MAATGQQHRPVRRAFRLFCTTFTCLLLLISTLSAPSAVSASSKVLRYGTQKTVGHSSALADMECRKRPVAGKVTPLDGTGLACLPARDDFRRQDADVATIIVRPAGLTSGRIETRGARAPPFHFA